MFEQWTATLIVCNNTMELGSHQWRSTGCCQEEQVYMLSEYQAYLCKQWRHTMALTMVVGAQLQFGWERHVRRLVQARACLMHVCGNS